MKEKTLRMRLGHNVSTILIKALGLGILIVGYALMVSAWVTRDIVSADRSGCLGPHITTAWGLSVLGMIAALLLISSVSTLIHTVMSAFLPHQSERLRWQIARTVAIVFLVGNALAGLIWTNPTLDLFVALHRPLRTEADLLILAMGFAGGVAWRTLWPKWAWLGLIISIIMTYMVLANTLSRHAWC